MICNSILDAMGNTPVIRLQRMVGENDAEILVKFEGLNVGGSIKTRTALNMIEQAEKQGLINSDSIIVEPTSGNQGIGLALVGAVKGYKVKIIMPDSVSEERRKLVGHYGAEVILVHDNGNIGLCIEECVALALRMRDEDENVFVPQQFENPANPAAHYATTGPEIWADTDGKVDIFVAGVGTGGTLTGSARYLKEMNPNVKVVAVEPDTSAVLSGKPAGAHGLSGIGAGFIPEVLDASLIDEIMPISVDEAKTACRELAAKEGIMCGITSGTNVAGALKLAKKLGKGKTVVTVLPDTAERYFSTPLFDEETLFG